jgi:hypothetical protein
LFGAIDPDASTFKILGTKVRPKCWNPAFISKVSVALPFSYLLFLTINKVPNCVLGYVILTGTFPFSVQVELILKKSDGKSWTLLEKTAKDLGGFQLTFGVGGRTGTIGAKEIIIDPSIQPQPKNQ